jgi:multidrug efflux pump
MIKTLIHNSAVIRLMVFVTITIGAYTYFVFLPRESQPDVKIPVVMVTTPYIGVAPKDIESLLTRPIENELASLQDIKKLSSSSVEGASVISIEFEPEVVIEDALQQVRDRVNRAKVKLPSDAEEPSVREISFSDLPVVILTLAGKNISEQRLKSIGDDIADSARRIGGVLDAKVTGGRQREIKVLVDPFRLSNLGLKLDDVLNAIRDENVNIPGGHVVTGDASFLLRVPGDFVEAIDLERVAVKRVGDRPVLLRDIARIVDAFEDRASYARMNGATAVSVAVSKRTGANILAVVNSFKALVVGKSASPSWPKGLNYRFLGDQSKFIDNMVSELENGIITALILVMAVLFFTMGLRNSLFVAFAIPASMLLGMLALAALGFTLNMIVLFSLILVLGMLVDNAIVIIENIYRHLEMGKSALEASIEGTQEVAMAVAASTATTVVAFLPMVFWGGIMGQFMGYLPKTVIIVLLASLVVAVVVLPVATARYMRLGSTKKADTTSRESAPSGVVALYIQLLERSIEYRYWSAAIGVITFLGTSFTYAFFNHGVEFFPPTEPNRATISIRAPDGTDLEATDKISRQVEAMLLAEENVDIYVAETGVSGGGDPLSGAQAASHSARITVDFLPDPNTALPHEKVRIEPSTQTIERLRAGVALITGAKITIEKERMGPPVGADVAVEISGDDFDKVGEAALALSRDLLQQVKGIAELDNDYRVGRPELRLRISRARAKRVGASTRQVAGAIRTAVAGTVATTLREGEDEYDIKVMVMPEYKKDLQRVLALRIPGRIDTSPDSFQVPLSSVAHYELSGGSGSIRHIDQDLVVTLMGNVKEGVNSNEVVAHVQTFLEKKAKLPPGIHARLAGAQDEQKDAEIFLGRAFIIATFLILIVLVAQFNRFDIPLIILASVILSFIGVLWGLMLTGTPFGIMMTGIGVISLAGIVVNNAIVLLDYIEQLRSSGLGVRDALIQAGVARFRPVVLTAITTVLGLVPMAIGLSYDFRNLKWIVGSQSATWWGPMAVAVIFGLAVSTILTLVMVPTLYSIFEDIRVRYQPRRSAPLN